jgi:hypothetical protein
MHTARKNFRYRCAYVRREKEQNPGRITIERNTRRNRDKKEIGGYPTDSKEGFPKTKASHKSNKTSKPTTSPTLSTHKQRQVMLCSRTKIMLPLYITSPGEGCL